MRVIEQTGEKVCSTRKELAQKYFMGMDIYASGNMGIIALLLSDTQNALGTQNPNTLEHYRQLLNDVKCVLIMDTKLVQKNGNTAATLLEAVINQQEQKNG